MDDVDDILNNSRAAEDDMADEDDEVEDDEEGQDQEVDDGENDEEEEDEDEDDGLGPKSGASEAGNQEDEDDDNEDDEEEDDNEDEEDDEAGSGNENASESRNVGQQVESGVSKSQEVVKEGDKSNYDTKHKENDKESGKDDGKDFGDENQNGINGAEESTNGKQPDQQDQDVEMKDVSATNAENGSGFTGEHTSATSKLNNLHNYYTQMLRSAKISDSYNIYPTAAIPIQTDVNAMAMSKGLKYLFLGGSDGFIRKYDFLNTMDGKLALTILQKHSLAESIQNAGILLSYWENEIPQKKSEIKFLKNNKEYEPKISPVHALEVQSECLFLLSGLDNGGITLQGVRYMEGSIGYYFKSKEGHNNVVNLLKLSGSEDRFLSGSWDKRLLEWDLQTGGIMNEYRGGTSEYSTIEWRPQYSSVNINDVATNLKSSSRQVQDDDDDMGSLFGDDEEQDSIMKADDGTKEGNTSTNAATTSEEISKTSLNVVYDESVFMTSGLNGSVHVWDRRTTNAPVLSLERGPKVPPWCQSACWSMDGDHIYVGRRNAVVEEFDLKNPIQPTNTLKLPGISGPVSCVKAMPNNKHVLCASKDNIRIYDTKADFSKGSTIPFLIVPGHHGGSISNIYVDPTCRFLISTSGNRGWQGNSTDTTFIYEIDLE